MAFEAPIITDAGINLFAQALDGATITFTKMQMGDGLLGATAIKEMTALVDPIITMPISSIARGENYASLVSNFSNIVYETFTGDGATASFALRAKPISVTSVKIDSTETEDYTYTASSGLVVFDSPPSAAAVIDITYSLPAFNWREIGIFAADPDDPDDRSKDILYCYQNAGDAPYPIPAPDPTPYTERITVSVYIGQAESVEIVVSQAMEATDVTFDPGDSGLTATTVEDAIKETYLLASQKISQSDLTSALATKADLEHAHGNLQSAGTLTETAVGTPGVDPMKPVFTGSDGKLGVLTAAEARTALGVPRIWAAAATLTAAGWSDAEPSTQTVTVEGMTADAHVIVSGDPEEAEAYAAWLDAGAYCSAQGEGTLTFTASMKPETELSVNLLVVEVIS